MARRSAGFTLMEVMVTVMIAGILAAFAVPSFRNMMVDQRIKGAGFDLTAALTLARSEAIKRNGSVTITPASGGTSWAAGWSVTAADNSIILTQGTLGDVTITGPTSIVYNRSGRSTAAVILQLSSPDTGSTVSPRCISVGLTGQPKSVVGTVC